MRTVEQNVLAIHFLASSTLLQPTLFPSPNFFWPSFVFQEGTPQKQRLFCLFATSTSLIFFFFLLYAFACVHVLSSFLESQQRLHFPDLYIYVKSVILSTLSVR